ncbi:hypothetical protein ACFFWE_03790 [Sphaerisporangium melleum]|uniref:hypothetical protein n=1 Tax=Sphaerisporangium melleum TaxID=321316 RepID=UPI00166ECCA7|nr:hypothetical protein [Sphaerisporangium melleum]
MTGAATALGVLLLALRVGVPLSVDLLIPSFGCGVLLNAIRATAVRLEGVGDRPVGTAGCVLLLGSAEGVTVVVDRRGAVWRVPADLAMTTSTCP